MTTAAASPDSPQGTRPAGGRSGLFRAGWILALLLLLVLGVFYVTFCRELPLKASARDSGLQLTFATTQKEWLEQMKW